MKFLSVKSFLRTTSVLVHPKALRRKHYSVTFASATTKDVVLVLNRHGVPTSSSSTPSWAAVLSHLVRSDKLEEARHVFDGIHPSPDLYHHTIMINAYSRAGRIQEALILFDGMPDKDVACWNSMVKGCLDCGDLLLARCLFDQTPAKNTISWTTMLDGLSRAGKIGEAEELFQNMPLRDAAAWNSMIFGYCRNGRTVEARKLFVKMPLPNVITWTTMIGGLNENGESEEALHLFRQMSISGVKPTSSTLACVLTACTGLSHLVFGSQIHGQVVKLGYPQNNFVSASLITFYATCKLVDDAYGAFQEDNCKTVVTWTALLTGYCSNGKYLDALDLLGKMRLAGVKPNQSTYTSALSSCCELEDLDRGEVIHASTVKVGLDIDVFVGNALIVLYSRCGAVNKALTVFDDMPTRNLVSWNTIIVGCAQNGWGQHALKLHQDMLADLIQPDEITYLGLLTACSHCGMLEKGRHFFHLLTQEPSIQVNLEHYVCMVDILGRSGTFDEAEDFIKSVSLEDNTTLWLTLLNACRMHCNIDTARRVSLYIFDLDPHKSSAYVLLSNLYASVGSWKDVSQIRNMMKCSGTEKVPGYSWINLKGIMHRFVCGDKSHPMTKEIYHMLDWLSGKLKESGYIADKAFVLHDVDEEQKELTLSMHSEKLAVAFGLLATVEGSVIRVVKNLRVCGDCHRAIKLISNVVHREIVLRDASRFHHFKNGLCSCGDYW